jgi:precorrin-2 dehydrogenase / sirohydrochlorin ferrochelatase
LKRDRATSCDPSGAGDTTIAGACGDLLRARPMSGYPLLLEGSRVLAVVVGGGQVAHRKAMSLLQSGATVRVIAPEVCDALRGAAAGCARVELVQRPYASGDVGEANLVVAATGSRTVNAQVAADALSAGRLVNVADAPEEGNCATVAAHRAEGLVVGVSAGGVPAAAARIRDALAARFDGRYGTAVATLGTLRRRLLADGRAESWRSAERELVGHDFCAAVERGEIPQRVAVWEASDRDAGTDEGPRGGGRARGGEETAWG